MFLECKNVSFKYPQAEMHIFKDISFGIRQPGFHALLGPSGVGKTSFARLIANEISGYSGELHIQEGSTIFYSYNQERLPGWSSIARHLDRITPSDKKQLRDDLIDVFGLNVCMKLKFAQLSLGQKNRINLLRYLLQDFTLLIMDESLANVDEPSKETILLEIKHRFPERYFLYISHNLIEVSKFCDQILVFRYAGNLPQTRALKGLNMFKDDALNRELLDATLLEIMNVY